MHQNLPFGDGSGNNNLNSSGIKQNRKSSEIKNADQNQMSVQEETNIMDALRKLNRIDLDLQVSRQSTIISTIIFPKLLQIQPY